MNKNIAIVLMVVFAGAGFYGGMKYQQGQTPDRGTGTFAGRTGGTGRGGVAFNGTFGQVIAKTATTITVQLADGSSRIVFISATTPVAKQASGTLNDVAVGTNIAVTGTSNSDGSVTASQIQIRPAGTPRPSPSPTP
jgi:nitrate/nitrite transporter NarK